MKALFVHDHIFKRKDEIYYSDKLSYKILSRYLKYFDSLDIFARTLNLSNTENKLPISSGENINFNTGENINSIKGILFNRKKIKKKLEELILSNDALIVRLPSEFGLIAINLAKKYNKPVYTEVVACAWDALWNYGKISAKIRAPLMYLQMKSAIQKSDYVIYVTNKFLQNRYPAKGKNLAVSDVEIQTLDNLIILNRLSKIKSNEKKIVIGLIGSFKTKYKGIDDAIYAISILSKKGYNVVFRILGSGDQRYYERIAKEKDVSSKVYFDGLLSSGREVWDWLDNISIYIQPSYQEGLPRALVEAMSRGCPAIGSNVGGIPELLDKENLIKAGDYKKLSELLEYGINNIDWQLSEAKKNFEKAKEYQKELLDEKRDNFLQSFKNYCVKK
jgi:glycosyltransferase involved in cell wall biosynthesis